MSDEIAEVMGELLAAGVAPQLIARVTALLATRQPVIMRDEAAERRREADRIRKQRSRGNLRTSADAPQTDLAPTCSNTLFVLTKEPTPIVPKSKPSADTEHPKFAAFWTAYPKRGVATNPRKPAAEKFTRLAREGAEPDAMISGAKRYSDAMHQSRLWGTDKVKQAITFLNQAVWEDYQTAVGDMPQTEPEWDGVSQPVALPQKIPEWQRSQPS